MLFSIIWRKLQYLLSNVNTKNSQSESSESETAQQYGASDVHETLNDNVSELKQLLSDGSDIKIHNFSFGPDRALSGALVFIDGLIDNQFITDAILRPLIQWGCTTQHATDGSILEMIRTEVLCAADTTIEKNVSDLSFGCLSGDSVLFVEGSSGGIIISTKGFEKRSVTTPPSESVVRGPREGFTENLRTNTALIRRKIKCGKLCSEPMIVGRRTQTSVCLMYIDGIADPKVIQTVKSRIKALDVDSILESGYIEQYIEDAPLSPFGTIGFSEKPDVVAGRMLEGRVAIIVDGTPFVMTAPMLFIESFQTAEDYYQRTIFSSIIRVLRYFAYLLAVFAPAIYVALTSFHQELLPTTLLLTIATAREGTPFPVLLEALIMVLTFEILREGGIRLPTPVGQAISIVGALVMGDAAVSAGIVGAPVVITIAITAVAGFLIPMQANSYTILRMIMLFLASFVGFFGIALGLIAVLIHLSTLTSFGVAYFDGLAWTRNQQDSLIRMPLWSMVRRPKHIAKGDTKRHRSFFIPPLRPYENSDNTESEGEQ